jgi:hypothetical protein
MCILDPPSPPHGGGVMRAALFVVALTACTGSIAVDGDGQSQGEQMFASTVQPMLRGRCVGCHEGAGAGPPFLGQAGADDDYDALRANAAVVGSFTAANALLLTKGSHDGVTWWTPAQQSTITAWLDTEAANVSVDGVTDVMAVWASCMTLDNWDDSRMGMWAAKQTEQNATCGGCHADGEYGFHANPTSDIMFAQQRTQRGITSFFQVSAAGGTASVVPAFDKLRNKCAGGNLHPSAAVDDQYVEYLQRFYDLTNAMRGAGLCGDPGYKNLTDPL